MDDYRTLAARGATQHDPSLGLFDEGFVASAGSTPGTAALRLRALAENPSALGRAGLHHGLLEDGFSVPRPGILVRRGRSPVSIGEACLGRSSLALPMFRAGASDQVATADTHGLRARMPAMVAEHVLLTTDGSESANRAIPLALMAIRACSSPRVTLLRVLTPKLGTPVHALEWAMARAHAEANLQQVASQLPWPERVTSIVAEGRAADQILHFVATHDVDLIVMSSHGSDDARTWRMGSTTRKVVASGLASVLVVPAESQLGSLASILVPLDCSARAECVLPLAAKLGEVHDAELVLTHVVPRPDVPQRLPSGRRERELVDELTQRSHERAASYLESVRERLATRGLRTRVELLSDINPARAIEHLVETSNCDLVLLSAHGSGCQHGERYGSTARRLLDSLVKPMWIVQDVPVEGPPFSQGQSGRSERA